MESRVRVTSFHILVHPGQHNHWYYRYPVSSDAKVIQCDLLESKMGAPGGAPDKGRVPELHGDLRR